MTPNLSHRLCERCSVEQIIQFGRNLFPRQYFPSYGKWVKISSFNWKVLKIDEAVRLRLDPSFHSVCKYHICLVSRFVVRFNLALLLLSLLNPCFRPACRQLPSRWKRKSQFVLFISAYGHSCAVRLNCAASEKSLSFRPSCNYRSIPPPIGSIPTR